jgi:predicted molibdopterin-dependent oxidoreductase YjgC
MGALPNVYTGYQRVDDSSVRERMAQSWGVDKLPETPGITATEMMNKAYTGDLKAL